MCYGVGSVRPSRLDCFATVKLRFALQLDRGGIGAAIRGGLDCIGLHSKRAKPWASWAGESGRPRGVHLLRAGSAGAHVAFDAVA